ncbi:MAG: protein-disulfide reductase DsbD family protein [Chitinophagales bacterium]
MKRGFLFGIIMVFTGALMAQVVNPVHWSWKAEKLKDNEFRLVFDVKLDAHWHTYGMYIADGGPVKTSINFEKNSDVELVGKMTETGAKVHEGMDEMFGMNVKYFEGSAQFVQVVRIKKSTVIKGSLEYMACDDKSCLPPDTKDFSLNLESDSKKKLSDDTVAISVPAETTASTVDTLPRVVAVTGGPCAFGAKGFDTAYFQKPLHECGRQINELSLIEAIIQGFLFGFLALFTPCVFPMIPLTVSLFTKRAESRSKGIADALTYAGSIVAIYFLLSLPFVLGASADTLNEFSTGAWYNLFMFVLLFIFAFSFLGFYDISLPSFLGTKTDAAADRGGAIGIFFMALTLAIVSFSCTGPLIGTLLGNLIGGPGGKIKLVAGMTSFGVALALPFALFALFPSWLNRMPKSGGWMDTFKVFLGFLEMIFAVKFLSNADLVSHWGVIKREVFLGIWVVLGLLLFLYAIGGIYFKAESPAVRWSPLRLFIALLSFLFVGYSAYGIFGHDTPLFSGFPPPKFYSFNTCKGECPLELPCYHDYCEALEEAKKTNKPLMIDFTGWACVNCRKMEENVWPDKEVYDHIRNDFILVSLYVDDKKELPDSLQYISPVTGKKIKTVGNKWSDFEISCFRNNSQPYYALVSPDEKLLNDPRGYTPNPDEYQQFLECGLNR